MVVNSQLCGLAAFFPSPHIDLFSAGDWPLLYDLQKPELQQFARGLPDVVLSGRADSTINKYLSAFQRWKVWAKSME